uniref:Uncharacterized protein n=1 Tax=Gadus morhua TaxID=8049 RepID=A0A8C5FNU2_GADMO
TKETKMSGIIKMLRKRKEVGFSLEIALLIFIIFNVSLILIIYFLSLNKTNNPEPWERLDPSKPQKLHTINQKWRPIAELEHVKSLTK